LVKQQLLPQEEAYLDKLLLQHLAREQLQVEEEAAALEARHLVLPLPPLLQELLVFLVVEAAV